MIIYIAYVLEPKAFSFITSDSLEITILINLNLLILAATVYLYMLIHEMIHAILIPNFMKSEKTVWGLNIVMPQWLCLLADSWEN